MNYKIKNAKDVCFGLTILAFLLAWSVIFDHRRSLADLLNYSTLDFNKTIYLSLEYFLPCNPGLSYRNELFPSN